MSKRGILPGRLLVAVYLTVVHVGLLYMIAERFAPRFVTLLPFGMGVSDPRPIESVPTPLPVPESVATAPVVEEPETSPAPANQAGLLIPVQGVRAEQLIDTFTQSRAEGRLHEAIDIAAPAGTPVLAVADGEIVKFWDSDKGGITIYQTSADKKFVYYYAHLQNRASGLKEGDFIRRGTIVGYVGDTGNAGTGNYHLHFSVAVLNDPKDYHNGTYVNPYPLLRAPVTP